MECGIYLIRCAANGMIYVGQSADIRKRWQRHQSHFSSEKKGTNKRLWRAARKYGTSSMTMEVLELCCVERLTEREQYWVDHFRSAAGKKLVNAMGPVDNPQRGIPKSPMHRARISAAKTGKQVPALMGDANPSRRPEMRARMTGELNPAKRPEVRLTMSARSGMARMVRDVTTGETWKTMSACAAQLGVSVAAVHAAATKKNPSVRGRILDRVPNAIAN